MNQKPFVLPLETPMGKYFYEVNRNEIVAVNDDLFECIKRLFRQKMETYSMCQRM